jgi:hypothetical protein
MVQEHQDQTTLIPHQSIYPKRRMNNAAFFISPD